MGEDFDARSRLDPIAQVLAHSLHQRVTPDQHRHLVGMVSEVEGGLAGGIRPSHDEDALPGMLLRVASGRPVVDPA
jgi:hypothetical protein